MDPRTLQVGDFVEVTYCRFGDGITHGVAQVVGRGQREVRLKKDHLLDCDSWRVLSLEEAALVVLAQ